MLVERIRRAVLIAVAAAGLTGCGTLNSTSVKTDANSPPSQVAAAVDATGGLSAWQQCRYFEVTGVVTAYQRDGSAYLTEHTFRVSPWLHAMSISAHEPRSDYVWQLVGHHFQRVEGNPDLDVSPLQADYQDYAEAVLEMMTAPVRLLEWDATLTDDPGTVATGGRPYHAIEAGSLTGIGRVYYQDEANSRVDMMWLANGDRTRFVMVRGYDYAPVSLTGVQIPMKVELFRSGPAHQVGPRFAQIEIRP